MCDVRSESKTSVTGNAWAMRWRAILRETPIACEQYPHGMPPRRGARARHLRLESRGAVAPAHAAQTAVAVAQLDKIPLVRVVTQPAQLFQRAEHGLRRAHVVLQEERARLLALHKGVQRRHDRERIAELVAHARQRQVVFAHGAAAVARLQAARRGRLAQTFRLGARAERRQPPVRARAVLCAQKGNVFPPPPVSTGGTVEVGDAPLGQPQR
eukprot:6199903-Pleurochrysis_carterae.AAC.1